jgi:hypothetical protein
MKNSVDMSVTLPQYLVLIGVPIPRVGLDSVNGVGAPTEDTLQGKKFTEEKHFMATKKKAAKKKKKH